MFHVLDHGDVVYSGELSQSTQYVIDRYGNSLDGAIRAGIRIAYGDSRFGLNAVGEAVPDHGTRDFWAPIEDWEID
jgi:hypothetical protein